MTTVQENKILTDTVEVENAALIELLEGASTHSSKDKSLYSLNSVQLEGAGAGYLVARATDRYRLIEGKIEVEHGQLSKSLISLADVGVTVRKFLNINSSSAKPLANLSMSIPLISFIPDVSAILQIQPHFNSLAICSSL